MGVFLFDKIAFFNYNYNIFFRNLMNLRRTYMVKNTIWVTGANGNLASQLVKKLKEDTSNKIIATDTDVDISDNEIVERTIDIYRPSVIINCAAISNVDYCEKNMVEAFKVNALGARNLAVAARKVNAKIIQLSTDDVFSGNRVGKLTEFDTPNPNSVYGKSKLAGENYVKELNPKHLIIRSSWVYGYSDEDFYSYVLNKAKNNEEFDVALDRLSTPTSADSLADFVISMIEKSEYGIFHASCEGACSRHEFARRILSSNGYSETLAKGVFYNSNNKVHSTLLENLMMKMTGLYEMPNWLDDLKRFSKIPKEEK